LDSYKILVLKKSLDDALKSYRDECQFDYECKPEYELKEYIYDISKQVFYALNSFRDAILEALKD